MSARQTWIDIDLDYLGDNLRLLGEVSKKTVFPVMKANAYGHGDILVSEYLIKKKVPYLCVSSLDEALFLYNRGISHDILIFSYVTLEEIKKHHKANFVYTISSYQWYQEYRTSGLSLRLHLEVNTGMNRTGLKTEEEILKVIADCPLEGYYTHFQNAENLLAGQQQLDLFKKYYDYLSDKAIWVHVGNAPLALVKEEAWINGYRYGLALFGYHKGFDLKPVLSLYTQVIHKDSLESGESLGYDYAYEATKTMSFATLPIGYADGFSYQQAAVPVIAHGKSYPLIGKICMDLCMMEADEELNVGDTVTLIGPGRDLISLAETFHTIPYVLLTQLSSRIERRYREEGNVIASIWRETIIRL